MMRRLLVLFGLLWLAVWMPQRASAASVQFQEIPVEYIFGDLVTFRVQIQAETSLQTVTLFYRYEGMTETNQADTILSPEGQASHTLDAHQVWIPAFARVDYWFVATLSDGTTATSPTYFFEYFDHRFDWNTSLDAPPMRIHWYGDDDNYAQTLLDAAQQGVEKINRLISALPTQEIDMYVYANALDMQSTLALANIRWVAGHADPWLGVVVVSLPPGPDRLELTRQRIPHELMHILLYQKTGVGYENLPTWFNEGLASMAELENNPDYYTILRKAHEQELSLPLIGLCESFPQEASNAFLAYAEAEVFTRYLYEQFGTQKMQELIASYADGLSCEHATEVVLGKSLNQLEAEWRGSLFGENVLALGMRDVLPWLVVLVIALLSPLLLSFTGPAKRRKYD